MRLIRLLAMFVTLARPLDSLVAQTPSGETTSGTTQSAKSELVGTSWQLVRITYNDDTIVIPDDPAKYTFEFVDETRVAARIDCNRANGTWESSEPGQIEFGPMAVTRAMCPPGSLHDRVLRDLPHFRSYLIKEGKLFLVLHMDGGTYEFKEASAPQK